MVGLGVMEIAILGVVCVLPVVIGSVVLLVVLTKKAAATPQRKAPTLRRKGELEKKN